MAGLQPPVPVGSPSCSSYKSLAFTRAGRADGGDLTVEFWFSSRFPCCQEGSPPLRYARRFRMRRLGWKRMAVNKNAAGTLIATTGF